MPVAAQRVECLISDHGYGHSRSWTDDAEEGARQERRVVRWNATGEAALPQA